MTSDKDFTALCLSFFASILGRAIKYNFLVGVGCGGEDTSQELQGMVYPRKTLCLLLQAQGWPGVRCPEDSIKQP